jgi:hypothetical protein
VIVSIRKKLKRNARYVEAKHKHHSKHSMSQTESTNVLTPRTAKEMIEQAVAAYAEIEARMRDEHLEFDWPANDNCIKPYTPSPKKRKAPSPNAQHTANTPNMPRTPPLICVCDPQ